MISVAHGTEYFKDGVVIFTGTEEVPCPLCGGKLRVHGTCHRKLQTSAGLKIYRLRVMKCTNTACGATHRELPRWIVPYKRVDAGYISKIIETPNMCGVETSTWMRLKAWVDWFICYAQNVLAALLLKNPSIRTIPDGNSLADRLMYFVRIVVNSQKWEQHRTA